MLKFGNKEFRNIQEQVEKNAKDIEELKEQGVPGSGDSGLPTDKPTDNGQILIGYTDGSVEWSTETIREFQHELVSGSNIKTINGESILGSGNIEISGGGTVSVDNVVEFDDNALISVSSSAPFVVDDAIMTKLQNPETIIKYNNYVYYYDKWIEANKTAEYKSCTAIHPTSETGKATIFYNLIYVRVESTGTYEPAGVWKVGQDAAHNIPTTLGTNYTEDGDYIWVANKSGTTKTSSWQKYTPGTGGGGGTGDLSNYYTKTETDEQFVTKTAFDTTTMGINSVLEDIPTTYATNAGLARLEATTMGEISSLDGRVDALEAGGGSGTGGNFAPQGSVTDNGQFLVGNINGTYEWSTQTLPEIYNATEEAKTTANEAKTITVGFSENLSNLQLSIDATDEDVAALDTRVTTLENSGGSGGGSSYTFTNGLTETDGTVSWDLNDNIKLVNTGTYPMVGIGNLGDLTISSPLSCRGTTLIGNMNYATIEPAGEGNLVAGNIHSGGRVVIKDSATGNLIGGDLPSVRSTVYGQGNIIWGKSGFNSNSSTGQSLFNGEASIVVGKGLIGPYNTKITGLAMFGTCNDSNTLTDKLLVLGNGANNGARSNAFTVDNVGNVVAAGTVSPTGADYAEYFEFEDGNPNNEDRMGLLVELVNGKIKLANGTDILGATSASKCVIGDAEEMNWHGKYEHDELGRVLFEEVELTELNPETGEEETKLVTTKKISKEYDPTMTYIPRSKRPEWYPVGLMGKVLVRQDGTLSVGDYVAAINGIATKANEKTNVRVLEVISENIVKILIK